MGKSRKKASKSKSKGKAPKPNPAVAPAPAIESKDEDEPVDLDLLEYQVGTGSMKVIPLRVQVPAVAYLLKKYGKYLVIEDEDDDEDADTDITSVVSPEASTKLKHQNKTGESQKKPVPDTKSKEQKRKPNVLDEEPTKILSKTPATRNLESRRTSSKRQTRSSSFEDLSFTTQFESSNSSSPENQEAVKSQPKAVPRRIINPKGKALTNPTSQLPKRVCLNTDFVKRLIRRKEPTPTPAELFDENDDNIDDFPSPPSSPVPDTPRTNHDYKCKLCSKNFQSNAILNMHMKKAHDPAKALDKISQVRPASGKEVCEFCNKEFPSTAILNMHKKKAHVPKADYPTKTSSQATCKICKFSFLSTNSLDLHMSEIHRMRSDHFVEDLGVPQIVKVTGNAVIKPSEPINIRYTCPYPQCQKQNLGFGTIEELKVHEDSVHKQKSLENQTHPCSSCSSIFSNPTSLKAHIRLRHNIPQPKVNKFVCTRCDNLTFPSNDCLERHNNLMHNQPQHAIISPSPRPAPASVENKFKCLVCSEDFADSALFRNHLLSHTRQFLTRSRAPGEVSGGTKVTQYAEVSSTMSVGTPLSNTMEDSMSPPIINLLSPSPQPTDDAEVEIIENPPIVNKPAPNAATKLRNLGKDTKSSSDEFEEHADIGEQQKKPQTFYCTNCWPRITFPSLQEFNEHNSTFHATKSKLPPPPPQSTVSSINVTPILTTTANVPIPKPPPRPISKPEVKKAIKCPLCPLKQFTALRYLQQHMSFKHKETARTHRKNMTNSDPSETYAPNNFLDVSITSEDLILDFDDQLLCSEAQEEQPVAITPSNVIIGPDFDTSVGTENENTVQDQPEVIIMDEYEPNVVTSAHGEDDGDEDGNFTFNIVNHPPPDVALN